MVELFEKRWSHLYTCTQIAITQPVHKENFKNMTKKLKNERVSIEESWIKKYAKSDDIVRVYSSDSALQMAYKIFGGFGVGQSCAVVGSEIRKVGTESELAACAAANAAGEDYESYYNGSWVLNCELIVEKVDIVWDKIQELCRRRGNTKYFNRKQLGGIWNIYRIR
jgi:hypothetical protein